MKPEPIRKRGRRTKQQIVSAEDFTAVKQAKATEQEALEALLGLKTDFPIVHFLLMDPKHPLKDETCRLIRLPLRQIVEQWKPAEKGWVRWRQQGLEICEAMDLA